MTSRFHSTVSRRDFMKGLGLAGTGVGVAAAAATGFHDLDELAGSYEQKRDWWIRERDYEDITTEVDWNTYQAYDPQAHPGVPVSEAVRAATQARVANDKAEGLAGRLPGYDRRGMAWYAASGQFNFNVPWTGADSCWKPSEGDNASPYNESPEYNLQVLRAAFHSFGTPAVGVIELNEHMKRLFNKGLCVWEDIEEPYQDEQRLYHIPNKCKWLVVWESQMTQNQGIFGYSKNPDTLSGYGSSVPLGRMDMQGYDWAGSVWNRATSFIKGLGYYALRPGGMMPSQNTAYGVFAGLSEQGRPNYRMSPGWGLCSRYADSAITDMPLAPTKPIDFGGHRFCNTCKRCGEVCPSQSIDMSDEPSWDTVVPRNNPGIKAFWMNWDTCSGFGAPVHCGICQPTCPFNHPSEAIIHPVVRAVAGTTGIFNGFFANMDRAFGYGEVRSADDIEGWWTRDLSTYKGDTINGAGKFNW
ncbi:reductive dehalogenase [Dehalogenimonas lykanthroporepellens BL-DC-9]|jgi:reductive dehalogenase|nr:reductive dehalogenase [Dehalogenimonas lykanthroporepellens BL-DC-9]